MILIGHSDSAIIEIFDYFIPEDSQDSQAYGQVTYVAGQNY